MTSVCVISNEVFPIDRGGIARLAYNVAADNANSGSPVDLHFLLPAKFQTQAALVEAEYRDLATIHYCRRSMEEIGSLGKSIQFHGAKDSLDQHAVESLRYYDGLLNVQRTLGAEFDIVEFPDYGGWGAAAIAAKRAGLAFRHTRFAIRLHSTLSLIVDHEPFAHEPSDWMAGICDLERQALRDADLVIAHLPSTARLNAERFAFPPAWMRKVRVELPPIKLSEPERAAMGNLRQNGEAASPPMNFLFSARLQPFKRPELFVRAAVRFLDEYADARNLFLVSSYGWDADFVDWVQRLVPARCQHRIRFLDGLAPQERAELMLSCILVIPSEFESLCLLAYEGRLLGLKIILNRRCLAFGSEPERWRDGDNCLFFEGDFISLAHTMRRALDWTPQPAADLPRSVPYWETPLSELFPAEPGAAPPLSLAHVIYGSTGLDSLPLQELQLNPDLAEVHILAPREAFDVASVPVNAWRACGVNIHLTSWLEPTACEVQAVIAGLRADAVAFLSADMTVERRFWGLAAAALGSLPDVAVFTSHVSLRDKDAAPGYCLNYGDAPTAALLADRIAHRSSVFRRDRLLEVGLRDAAGERWYEDMCIRLVNAGHKVLVAPSALAIQTGGKRYSRIQSSRFFATHRDEAGRRHGAAYRQASAGVSVVDSIESIDHATWVSRQEQEKTKLAAAARPGFETLSFDAVVLKSATSNEATNYKELEIAIQNLHVGRVSIGWLGFKFSQYKGHAQLEFRDSGNADKFFKDWPPPTADAWGPVALWSANPSPHPQGVFFEQAGERDMQRLHLLLDSLPAIVSLLPLTPAEQESWNDRANALLLKSTSAPKAPARP